MILFLERSTSFQNPLLVWRESMENQVSSGLLCFLMHPWPLMVFLALRSKPPPHPFFSMSLAKTTQELGR